MSDWRFRIQRTVGFIKILFRSKMAILGLIILIVYGFLAIAAPIVTPYDPQNSIVAGSYAPPLWYNSFSPSLSQNFQLEPKQAFYSDPITNGWTFKTTDPSHISEAYDTSTSNTAGAGSLRITLNRSDGPFNGTFTATLMKQFNWPYNGPPERFSGSIAVKAPDATPLQPVGATVFVERLADNRIINLTDNTANSMAAGVNNLSWASYPFTTHDWQFPRFLDSNDESVREVLHTTNIDPASLIFSSPGQYAYGVTVTLTSFTTPSTTNPTGPITVYLDQLNLRLFGTSWGLLGTDAEGLDIWSQLVYGARVSLVVGFLSAFIGIGLGLMIGLIAGYMGKIVDEVLMRFTDMLLVIPGLPLLIVLISVIGTTLGSSRLPILILVIGFLGWMGFARVVRAQVLSLKERPFVEAAKASGAGTGHITTHHIVPNIVGLIYVNLALAVPGAILTEAALSFLGLGDVTVMSWGRMLNLVEETGSQRIWWWVLPPGLSIALVSLAFVMIGFSLDTLFNPRLRQRR